MPLHVSIECRHNDPAATSIIITIPIGGEQSSSITFLFLLNRISVEHPLWRKGRRSPCPESIIKDDWFRSIPTGVLSPFKSFHFYYPRFCGTPIFSEGCSLMSCRSLGWFDRQDLTFYFPTATAPTTAEREKKMREYFLPPSFSLSPRCGIIYFVCLLWVGNDGDNSKSPENVGLKAIHYDSRVPRLLATVLCSVMKGVSSAKVIGITTRSKISSPMIFV